MPTPDRGCIAAGTPPEACAAGFVADLDGCMAILPESPCPAGAMALPGETQCREVAPCGAGPWPDVGDSAAVEYVDATYTGQDSDGSASKPWRTLGEAAADAPREATIAIAAGSYPESIKVTGKALRFVGRCPALVEIAGTESSPAAIWFATGASGSEIADLAVTGKRGGVIVSSAVDVQLRRVWIHDVGERGLSVERFNVPTSAALIGSLVEGATGFAVVSLGSEVDIQDSALRDTVPEGGIGAGIAGENGMSPEDRARVLVRGSVIERQPGLAVYMLGSDVEIDRTLVRDTFASPSGAGQAVSARNAPGGGRGTLALRGSVVERSHEVAVSIIGSDATIESSTIRDTQPNAAGVGVGVRISSQSHQPTAATMVASVVSGSLGVGMFVLGADVSVESSVIRDTSAELDGEHGKGIEVQTLESALPAKLHLLGSRVERSTRTGIMIFGSEATLEHSIVADTRPDEEGLMGWGVGVSDQVELGARGRLVLRSSAVERSTQAGIAAFDADVELDASAVRDTAVDAHGFYGRGLALNGASAFVKRSLIERNHEMGIGIVSSTATLEAVLIRDTAPNGAARLGDGIVVVTTDQPASAHITASRVAASARAALSNFGASVVFGASAFECSGFDFEGEQYLGRQYEFTPAGGGSFCGCPEAASECQVLQGEGVGPPPTLDPPSALFEL